MDDWVKENTLNIILSFSLAISGGILGYFLVPPEQKILTIEKTVINVFSNTARVCITITLSLMWSFFGWFLAEYFKILKRRKKETQELKKEREQFLSQIDKKMDDRITRMIEHSALYTENQRLEKALDLLRKTRGKKMWIVAKFISKQLASSFSALQIEIDGDDYSAFAESLYPECEDSICLTCPFTPIEWFEQLGLSSERLRQMFNKGGHIHESDLPPHVKALLSSPAKVKRLVILSSDKWRRELNKEKSQYLEEFLEVNKSIETKFVTREELRSRTGCDYDENLDFAVFDRQLMLIWERPLLAAEKKPLTLCPEIPDEYKRLHEFFRFERYPFFKSGEKVLEEIKQLC